MTWSSPAELARELFERGWSFGRLSQALQVPEGTVKSWRSRGEWRRLPATPTAAGQKGADATPLAPHQGAVETDAFYELLNGLRDGVKLEFCRGVAWVHMNGKGEIDKKTNFFGLKHGHYPPPAWCIPATVRGETLFRLLRERSHLAKRKDGHRLCREAEERRTRARPASEAPTPRRRLARQSRSSKPIQEEERA